MKRDPRLTSKIAFVAVAAGLAALATAPARADLVQDPSFASGAFAPDWSASVFWSIDTTNPAPGDSFDATSACPVASVCIGSQLASLTQVLSTVSGGVYSLSFSFDSGVATSVFPSELAILWGGSTVYDTSFETGASGYSQITVNDLVATGSNTSLTFLAASSAGQVYLDDVSVVPEPASLSLLGFGLVALGVVRRRKKA